MNVSETNFRVLQSPLPQGSERRPKAAASCYKTSLPNTEGDVHNSAERAMFRNEDLSTEYRGRREQFRWNGNLQKKGGVYI